MRPETSPPPGGPGPSTGTPTPGVTPTTQGPGLGTPSTSGNLNTPLAQVGAGTGGASGVSAAGPGNLKLQGSLSPNIYPWQSAGDQGQQGL